MTFRRLLTVAVLVTVAVNALALAPQHEAWGKSAVSFLFTDEEAAAWKAIKSDQEAQAFQDLFWARRDPTPATPKNEFRESVEARIRYADEKFAPARKKTPGSMTERGMMLIVFGQPHRVAQQDATQQLGASAGAGRVGVGTSSGTLGTTGGTDLSQVQSAVAGRLNTYQVWLYEGEHVRQLFGAPRAEFTFVDRTNTQEFGLERGGPIDVAAWRKKVVASYITQPQLTRAPQFTTVPMGGTAITAAPVAVMTSLTTPALASAVAEAKAATANPYAGRAYASYGEFITGEGDYFVPVMLYVPKSSPAAAEQNLTFFGLVEDASGKSVLAFEEPAKLIASKDDFYVDRTLTLPAGKHRGYFGLAANGKTVALVPADLQLAGSIDKSASGFSPLILSNNIYALEEAQRPTDPFAFGGTKVVPKADKTFRAATDELWYFFEVRNPAVDEAGAPKMQIKVDITGKTTEGQSVKKSAPLSEAEVMAIKGVPGRYAIGSAFPLATFKPGDYTISIKVIDTVSKASHTLTETFKVLP